MQKSMCVFLFVVLQTSWATGAEVAVFLAKGVNIQPGELAAISELFYQAYANCSKQSVIGPSDANQALAQSQSLAAAASLLNVNQFIDLSVVRLEQKITINAVLKERTGQEIFRANMSAYSMDDMEQVLDRLAKAVFKRVPPEETRDMHNVTQKEAAEENRLFAEKINGIKVAGFWVLSSDGLDTNAVVSAQYDLRLEGRRFFLEMGTGLGLPAGTGARSYWRLFLEIGGSYYFVNSEISPYLGVGLIPSIVFSGDIEDAVAVNLAPYLQFGVMFMRSSSTRVYADLRASHDLFEYQNGTLLERGQGTFRITELSLQVGIGW